MNIQVPKYYECLLVPRAISNEVKALLLSEMLLAEEVVAGVSRLVSYEQYCIDRVAAKMAKEIDARIISEIAARGQG